MSNHVLLTAEDHRSLRIRTDHGAELGDAVMCCLTVPAEFRKVQDEYPILFRLDAARERFSAWAMFGFENGENLFLNEGRWDARYRPLAMDIQPFLIGGRADDAGDKQVHVDLDSPRVAEAGESVRVFDDLGQPTPYLEAIAERLGELDQGYREADGFLEAMNRHGLLEPLTLEITLDDGSTNRLVGFHAVNEDRLSTLSATALGELQAAGHLMPLFMAVASIGRFQALIDRKNRALRHG